MSGNMRKALHKFLKDNFNFVKRGGPNLHKERKYEHISISEDFERIEKERKYQRLSLLEYRKKLRQKLITQKLDLLKESKENLEQLGEQDLLREAQEVARIKDMGKYSSLEEYKAAVEKEAQTKKIEDASQQKRPEQTIEQLEKELQRVSEDIAAIDMTKKEITDVEKKIEDLEPDYILITGMKKKMILNTIAYYEFQLRNLEGITIHPEAKKAIETVHYHLEHNLPVRRELLYEVAPELFDTEIGELGQYERERVLSKRPRLVSDPRSIVRTVEDVPEDRKLDDFEEFRKQEVDFMEFVYSKAGEFTEKYEDYIAARLAQDFVNMEAVLENLEARPVNELDDFEQEMLRDLKDFRRINNDHAELVKLNKVRVFKKQRELQMPEFVQNHERLREAWTEKWEKLISNSFDLRESILVPDNSATHESKLDKILKEQRAMDIHDLINESQEQYKAKVGGSEPIRSLDRNKKNEDLVRKANILSGAMNQIVEDPGKMRTRNLAHFQQHESMERPEESRVLLDEFTKVLFLNNTNPEKYNLTFWADHFNIQPQKLRNIFNFLSYAVPVDDESREIGRVFRFIHETNKPKSTKSIAEEGPTQQ